MPLQCFLCVGQYSEPKQIGKIRRKFPYGRGGGGGGLLLGNFPHIIPFIFLKASLTLDTFGFPEGARSAARRAVFWHLWPKMALFEPKMLFFGPSGHPGVQIATVLAQKSCRFFDHSRKMGCRSKYVFWPKKLFFWPKNQFFSTLRPNNPIISPETDPTQWDHIYPNPHVLR